MRFSVVFIFLATFLHQKLHIVRELETVRQKYDSFSKRPWFLTVRLCLEGVRSDRYDSTAGKFLWKYERRYDILAREFIS